MCAPAEASPSDIDPARLAGRMRVLASGSEGNCALLEWLEGGVPRRCLIDAGLSPRRTRRLLGQCAAAPTDEPPVPDVVLTHLDGDHAHRGWAGARAWPARFHVHRRHASYARALLPGRDLRAFDGEVDLGPGILARTAMMSHDERGTVAYRFDFPCGASLAYATDLGRATQALIDLFHGVDVLALESNYCPRMQAASGRSAYLKRRIMDGAGHLSNEQSARAVGAIGPRVHLVLLHLSRDCNHEQIAAAAHAGAPCPVTIASQHGPTDWIGVPRGRMSARNGGQHPRVVQPSLFGAMAATITA